MSTAPETARHPTPDERVARGKAARHKVPREGHARWDPPSDRPDPVELLERQAADRVPELVPIRYGRMLTSPFAFYRGAAAIMASDLAGSPRSGLRVQLCGDAHVSNFGGFASPGRELVFDVNDFDETLPGPWEWDVKRLAASIDVAGRERGSSAKERRTAVVAAVARYRTSMQGFARMRDIEVWYARLTEPEMKDLVETEAGKRQVRTFERTVAKAMTKDSLRALSKLTHQVDGRLRIISDPPLIVPIDRLLQGEDRAQQEEWARRILGTYRRSLLGDRKRLLEQYRYVDLARKVVGVGSVGTGCWIALLLGRDDADPLFLQFKEAQRSVLEPFAGRSRYASQGQRVVEGQRLMQATSDIFLGWDRVRDPDGVVRDAYVRQLWDWKASADLGTMTHRGLDVYGQACAWALARAHARSGDRIAIGAYLGGSAAFDHAVAGFAESYADQNERDFHALADAAASKRIVALPGV